MVEEISMMERLGIPAAFLLLMYILYVKTQAWYQKHEENNQQRYEDLVNKSQTKYEELTHKFIDTMNRIVLENSKCMSNLCDKMDDHIRSKENFIEAMDNKDTTINEMFELLKDNIKANKQ